MNACYLAQQRSISIWPRKNIKGLCYQKCNVLQEDANEEEDTKELRTIIHQKKTPKDISKECSINTEFWKMEVSTRKYR